jgi:hypothetical protein
MRVFDSRRFKLKFIRTRDDLRTELDFKILPVKRGLVAPPGDWPWSSWRFYSLEDSSVLTMDRMP